jgi:hypothetical protein
MMFSIGKAVERTRVSSALCCTVVVRNEMAAKYFFKFGFRRRLRRHKKRRAALIRIEQPVSSWRPQIVVHNLKDNSDSVEAVGISCG